jgi:branched-chain amino acid transport system permease protein
MVFWSMLSGNLINGAILGAVYGLMTMGLSLIFGVLRIVNVGHGAFIMVGAYVAYLLFAILGLIPLMAVPVGLVLGMALGFFFFYTIMRRLVEAPELSTLLATFSIGILLEEVSKFLWGPDFRGYSWDIGKIHLGVTTIPNGKILAFLSSLVVAYGLYVWFRRTRAGMALQCVVEDKEGARVCGINVGGFLALSFALGLGLTVLAGVLLTLFIPVGINPYMGGPYTLKAFVIAVLGGLGSPWGAFFGGFIFGLVENGSYSLFGLIPGVEPFSLTQFLAFVTLLFILLIKPEGLLGGK